MQSVAKPIVVRFWAEEKLKVSNPTSALFDESNSEFTGVSVALRNSSVPVVNVDLFQTKDIVITKLRRVNKF